MSNDITRVEILVRPNARPVTVDDIHRMAADVEYVWTEFVDSDVAEAAEAAVAALRKLAHLIRPVDPNAEEDDETYWKNFRRP